MPDMMHVVERFVGRQLELLGARSRWVENGAGRIHFYDIEGRGSLPPLVLLHGLSAGAATQYFLFLPYLKRHFSRIIAPELPGHGASGLPPDGITSRSLLVALEDAIDASVTGPVILFGSSLGGAVAARYAARHPSRVAKLILCSPAGAPIPEDERDEFLAQFEIRSHRDALTFVDAVFPRRNRLRQLLAWGVRQQFNRPHLKALLSRVEEESFLGPEELGGLPMPVLLLWGTEDQILPISHRDYFVEHLPRHAQIDLPEGFGHTPFLDRTREVADRVAEFASGLVAN